MKARLLFAALALTALGAIAGYAVAPKFHPPKGTPEQRLVARAVLFYQAMRRADMLAMARLKTPARQIYEAGELRQEAEKNATRLKNNFSKQALDNMAEGAKGITPADIRTRIEGKWALTWGASTVYASGSALPFPLDKMVWVYDHGDWWVYELKPHEANAYGNPPDFARIVLRERLGEEAVDFNDLGSTGATDTGAAGTITTGSGMAGK